jgi:NADH:ubiquinone oxidoreductase subunit 2 (subunit N)
MGNIRLVSALMLLVMVVYTVFVVMNHGVNFVPEYIGNIVAMNWAGQFQMDFTCYLILSALWVAWRHEFSGAGIGLAVCAVCGGMLFFAAYVLVTALQEKGDVQAFVVGKRRGSAPAAN